MYCIHVLYWHGDGLLVEQMVKTSHPYNCWPKTLHRVIGVLWSNMTWGSTLHHVIGVLWSDMTLGVNTAPCHRCAVVRHDLGVKTNQSNQQNHWTQKTAGTLTNTTLETLQSASTLSQHRSRSSADKRDSNLELLYLWKNSQNNYLTPVEYIIWTLLCKKE